MGKVTASSLIKMPDCERRLGSERTGPHMPDKPLTRFDEQGFLSTDIENTIEYIRAKYSDWLEFLFEVNSFAQRNQYTLEVHPDNPQEIVVATLYSRTLSNVQAATLLCLRGMGVQTRIMLRSALESLFSLVAISLDSRLANDFIAADTLARKRIYHKLQAWPAHLKKDVHEEVLNEKLQEIEESIAALNPKRMSVEEMSMKAGMHEWYVTIYSVLSDSVHTSVRDLEDHLVLDGARSVEQLKNEPTVEDLDSLFLICIEFLLHSLSAIDRVFTLGIDSSISQHKYRLVSLAKKYKLIEGD